MEIEEKIEPIAVYNEFRASLGELKALNESVIFDYTTKDGDKAARSHVYKLRQTKTAVTAARKAEKEESLAYGRRVDAEAKAIIDQVEAMIAVHQARIDEVAELERARVNRHVEDLEAISELGRATGTAEQLNAALVEVDAIQLGELWEEFEERAATAVATVRTKLLDAIAAQVKIESDQAELAALREQNAKLQAAEDQRQREAEELKRKEEATRRAEEKAIADAERKAAAEKAAAERLEQAKAEAAAEVIRKAEEQAAAEQAEIERRAENKRIRQRTHKAMERALEECGIVDSKAVVEALAGGTVPHIKITY